MNNMKLYDFSEQYQNVINFLEENEEVTFEDVKDTLEAIEASADEKIANTGKVIQKLTDDLTVIKERKKVIETLKKSKERNIENLKQYLLLNMQQLNKTKVETPTVKVRIGNSKKMIITDQAQLPKEYVEVKTEEKVKLADFKKYYSGLSKEEQENITYAHMQTNQNIQVK